MGVIESRSTAMQQPQTAHHRSTATQKSCVDFIGIIYVLLRQEGLSSL
jgi:hypothetical protein